MAQISDGALRKVLAEIEARAISSAQSLQQVNGQIQAVEREKRMLQLTQTELSSYPTDTNVYVGVGKMFMKDDLGVVKKKLEGQIKEQDDSVENLKKKQTYLETTFKNAQSHIDEILRRR